jgi:hypothetical protein
MPDSTYERYSVVVVDNFRKFIVTIRWNMIAVGIFGRGWKPQPIFEVDSAGQKNIFFL